MIITLRGVLGRWLRTSIVLAPGWRRAPFLLRRFAMLLVAVAGSSLILATVSGSGPLFLSSSANAALQNGIEATCPWATGVGFAISGQLAGDVIETRTVPTGHVRVGTPEEVTARRERFVAQAGSSIPDLLPAERAGYGSPVSVVTAGRSARDTIRVIFRDDALRHVTRLQAAGGDGVWITDTTARRIGAQPGQTIGLSSEASGARVRVAGIYRDLRTQPRTDFWCAQERLIYPLSAFASSAPPPLAIATREDFLRLGKQLGERGAQFVWVYPIRPGLTLPEAKDLSLRIGVAVEDVRGHFEERIRMFGTSVGASSGMPHIVQSAEDTLATLRGPVETVTIAARLAALAVIAMAGMFWVERRRTEVALLRSLGASAWSIGAKVGLETLVPTALATVGGWYLARWLVALLGPSEALDAPSLAAAQRTVIWSALAAVVLFGTVAAVSSVRALDVVGPRRAPHLRRVPWDAVALVLAGAAYYEILARGGQPVSLGGTVPRVDWLLLLFPILFLLGASGLVGRVLRHVLPALRRTTTRLPPSMFFAFRRLSQTSSAALAVVVAASVSIGILVYASTMTTSTSATSRAKAGIFVGSDVALTLQGRPDVPASFPFPKTRVRKIDQTVPSGAGPSVHVLGIDPVTFARSAFWDPSFADEPLEELLRSLIAVPDNGRHPAVLVGDPLPPEPVILLPSADLPRLPVTIVHTARAFPGMSASGATVVLNSAAVEQTTVGDDDLWVRGDPRRILASASQLGLPLIRSVSSQDVLQNPDFFALSWTFGFLQALGILTGLIALGAAILLLQARQQSREVSYALARRMEVPRGVHLRSILVELGLILGAGYVIGACLAGLAGRMVIGELDAMPSIPPPPLFRLPLVILAASAAAALVATLVGGWRVQRSADRMKVSEVLRVGA